MISKLMSAIYKEVRKTNENDVAFPIMVSWCMFVGYALINLWKYNNINEDLFAILIKEYGVIGMPDWSLSLYDYDEPTEEQTQEHIYDCGLASIFDSRFNPPFKMYLETELWTFEI